jgi:hypothetical protein
LFEGPSEAEIKRGTIFGITVLVEIAFVTAVGSGEETSESRLFS